ncbi:hypothetical protein CROQUDRAFT_298067 [Cronartium quercuum f. sp. fusiforme G11]|uniref:Uncharacterized protein n=1 Tax=Cronartium quercuum f. sp. fusiforme G11 TaxID=708437 RepID=A0A9P6T897_9BASI|nr:hypothetical protein CROQUDRAFT_298067 [Cronartium quercuum f. sp. fusiforme G11]
MYLIIRYQEPDYRDEDEDPYYTLKKLLQRKREELANSLDSDFKPEFINLIDRLRRLLDRAHVKFHRARRFRVRRRDVRYIKRIEVYLRSLKPFLQNLNNSLSKYNDSPTFRATQLPSLSCITMRYMLSYENPGIEKLEMSYRRARKELGHGLIELFSHCRTSDLPPKKTIGNNNNNHVLKCN